MNSLDDEYHTALHIASSSSRISDDIVQQLVYMGADVSLRDHDGFTAIMLAAQCSPTKLKMVIIIKSISFMASLFTHFVLSLWCMLCIFCIFCMFSMFIK